MENENSSLVNGVVWGTEHRSNAAVLVEFYSHLLQKNTKTNNCVRMCMYYLSISSVWRYEVGCCCWEESQQ